jgi:hypothetical protein
MAAANTGGFSFVSRFGWRGFAVKSNSKNGRKQVPRVTRNGKKEKQELVG